MSTVYDYFDLWGWDGTLDRIHELLYAKCREQASREASPTAAIIDSQSVRSAEKGGFTIRRATTPASRAPHCVQTGDGRVQRLAAFERSKPVAESRQRHEVQRRNRNCRRNQIRRFTPAVTDFPA